jgi:hypothetical protein
MLQAKQNFTPKVATDHVQKKGLAMPVELSISVDISSIE